MPSGPFRNIYERLGPTLAIATTFSAVAAPKVVAWLLPLLGGLVPLAFPKDRKLLAPHLGTNAIVVTCGLFAIDALLSTVWSTDKRATFTAGALFGLYFFCAWLAQAGVELETDAIVEALSKAIVVAVFAGAGFLIIELLTHSFIERELFTYAPVVRPSSPEHVGMLNGRVAFLAPDELNGGVAVLNVLLWPALLVLAAQGGAGRAKLAAMGLVALVAIATFLSEHETSKIAIVCAGLVFLLHYLKPDLARGLVVAGWLAATLLVLPAVHAAYWANLHTAEWLSVNGRARIIIWAATAERLREAPVLGVGAGSTKRLTQLHGAEERPGFVVPWQTGAHAHNIYLQTWYELGLLGAALLAAIGWSVLCWILRLPTLPQGYVLSAFVSAAAIGASSWGMWQPWFMASCFYASVLAALAARRARDACGSQGAPRNP
jgi:O-antigen ligase